MSTLSARSLFNVAPFRFRGRLLHSLSQRSLSLSSSFDVKQQSKTCSPQLLPLALHRTISRTTTPLPTLLSPTRWLSSSSLVPPPGVHALEVSSLGSGNDETTGQVSEIHVVEGGQVEAGDIVATIVANEQAHEIPAPIAGKVIKLLVTVGQAVSLNDALCWIQPNTTTNDASEETKQQSQQQQPNEEGDEPPHHTAAKHLIQHISGNGGLISKDYMEGEILATADVDTLLHLARLIRDQIQHLRPQALTLLEKALSIQQQQVEATTTGEDGMKQLAQIHTEIGILQHQLGDSEMALHSVTRALELRKQHLGEHHAETAATHIHLGMLLQQVGQYDKAIEALKTALDIQVMHVGEDKHPILAASHNNLGALYYRTSQFDNAVHHYSQALQIYQSVHGEEHNDTAGTYNNLAMALKFQNKQTHPDSMNQALEHCRTALQIRQKLLGAKHADTAASHYSLAQLLSEASPPQLDASLEQYQAACNIQTTLYGAESPIVAATYNNIGAVRYQLKDMNGALKEYARALEALEASKDQNPQASYDLAATHNNRGIALFQSGDLEAALEAHQQAQQLLLHDSSSSSSTPNSNVAQQLAMTVGSIGNIYKAQRNWDKALESYQIAHDHLERGVGTNHPDVAASHNNRGLALSALGRFSDAAEQYRAARHVFAATMGPQHPHVASCHFNLALSMVQQQEQEQQQKPSAEQNSQLLKQAASEFEQARSIWTTTLGLEHAQTRLAMKYAQDPTLALTNR